MLLMKAIFPLLGLTGVLGMAVPETSPAAISKLVPTALNSKRLVLAKRTGSTKDMDLPDGNDAVLRTAAPGAPTDYWTPGDWAEMFAAAARDIANTIYRRNEVNIGLTTSFRDHTGSERRIDCEVSQGAGTSISIASAAQNVQQACLAAEQLADDGWTGFRGTSRNTLVVLFGRGVEGLSIMVNVLDH
jgi:hypothetical protein